MAEQTTPTSRPPVLVLRLSPQAFAYLEAVAAKSELGPVKQAEKVIEEWAQSRMLMAIQ